MKTKIKMILILIIVSFLLVGCQTSIEQIENNMNESQGDKQMILKMKGEELKVSLEDNRTVHHLLEQLPITMTMDDLHRNEKYYYMPITLPTQKENVQFIQAGDVMLFGNDCFVIFYESFSTSYSYTRIGHIDDVKRLKSLVGSGNIEVTLQKDYIYK